MNTWRVASAVALALVLVGCSSGGGAGDAPKGSYSRVGTGGATTTIVFNDGGKGTITGGSGTVTDFTYTWDAKTTTATVNFSSGSLTSSSRTMLGVLSSPKGKTQDLPSATRA